jgi:peptide/nickel transport system substrate-binding protein
MLGLTSRTSKLRRSTTAGVFAALIAAALAGGQAQKAFGVVSDRGGDSAAAPLVINMSVAPATIDPASACGLTDLTVVDNVYSRLTRYGSRRGPNGTTRVDPSHIVPDLAKSWKITNGGKKYTFKLRSGVTFASGRPVDAAAVKYSWERTIAMAGCGVTIMSDGYVSPNQIASMSAPNPTTFVVTLTHPNKNALQDWAQASASIVDPALVEANGGVQPGKTNPWMASHEAGAGPYNLQSYSPNNQAVFVANPRYWRQPKAKTVIINFISSDPTLLLQARSGAADVTLGLTGQSVASLRGNKAVRIVADDATLSQQIGLANDKAPLNNLKVREALHLALPYKQILNKVAFGYGKLYYGPVQPAYPTFNAALSKPLALNLTKAKALMKASGVATPFTLPMVIQAGNAVQGQIAAVAQGVWKGLGVNVVIQPLAPSDYITALFGHKVDSYIRTSGAGIIDAGYYLDYDMRCGQANNLVSMCVPAADKLLLQMRASTNEKKRQQLLNKITALWRADFPKIQVYGYKDVAVLNKRVKSYFYSHELDFSGWSK